MAHPKISHRGQYRKVHIRRKIKSTNKEVIEIDPKEIAQKALAYSSAIFWKKLFSITERTQRHISSFSGDFIHSLAWFFWLVVKSMATTNYIKILSQLKDSCAIDVVREMVSPMSKFADGRFLLPLIPLNEFISFTKRFRKKTTFIGKDPTSQA